MNKAGLSQIISFLNNPGVRKLLSLTRRSIDRLIYPPTCAGCRAFSSQHNALCAQCWKDIHFIDRPYCNVTGRPFSYELGQDIISADAIADPPPFIRARAAVIYSGIARQIVHQFKFKDQTNLSHLMAQWMMRAGRDCLDNADCIIPIPLHRWRLIHRKYNQSAELARMIGQKSDIKFLPSTLIRQRHTKPQVGLAAKARMDNVRGAFKVIHEKKIEIAARHVVLVDDVFTTGATVNAATRVLLRAGAREVSVLTFARVFHE